MTPWEVNFVHRHWEFYVYYLGSGKIVLKIKMPYFNLNKGPTKFYNVLTPTSAKMGGDNKLN